MRGRRPGCAVPRSRAAHVRPRRRLAAQTNAVAPRGHHLVEAELAVGEAHGGGHQVRDPGAVDALAHQRPRPRGVPDPGMVAQIGVKDLTLDRVQRTFSDNDLRRQIVHGSENMKMPSFAGALTDDQIAAVIAHVRTLGSR